MEEDTKLILVAVKGHQNALEEKNAPVVRDDWSSWKGPSNGCLPCKVSGGADSTPRSWCCENDPCRVDPEPVNVWLSVRPWWRWPFWLR